MGGQNPYIEQADVPLPTTRYNVTFLPMNVTVEVDPAELPYGDHGLPGSILDIALKNKVDIDHACGGVCACSTCHVVVRKGLQTCNESTDDELDMLDNAYAVEMNSRLSCQCVPNGSEDIVIDIPEWNRNLAKEEH